MDQLQRLACDLQTAVLRDVQGHDAQAAASWADDFVEETFAEAPRPRLLRIYLTEIEKKSPRARELQEQIEAIRRVIA